MNPFDKPLEEWTLDEMRLGLVALGERIVERVAAGESVDAWQSVAALLADERDRRISLIRAVDEATNPFTVVAAGITDLDSDD